MLTDTKLRNLKPQAKIFKVTDRDGLYVAVTPAGGISFRYNYSLNGRQETITFGRGHGIWFALLLWHLLGYSAANAEEMRAFRRFQQALPMRNCAVLRSVRRFAVSRSAPCPHLRLNIKSVYSNARHWPLKPRTTQFWDASLT